MKKQFKHLGIYSDLYSEAANQTHLYPDQFSGSRTRRNLKKVLGFTKGDEFPQDVRIEDRWLCDGIQGEVISWWVGYGPRTFAWLLKPEGVKTKLPGILALHDHGGFKFYGKEKIASGPGDVNLTQINWWNDVYGGRPFADELCKKGFVVLVHDTFLWGSRKFPLKDMPEQDLDKGRIITKEIPSPHLPDEIYTYNATAGFHEHTIEKYCNLLGTTLAGVVSHEDRIALNYLASRSEIQPKKLGCIGLSGGGNRSALLLATNNKIQAAVIVGLMSTYFDLLDHNVISHTWMFFPQGWSRYGDWPDIAASRVPMPLLVQYDREDELFTLNGMMNAHKHIQDIYKNNNANTKYSGEFFPGPHKFDEFMQESAFNWLTKQLKLEI